MSTLIFSGGTFLDSYAKMFALMVMSELNQNNRVSSDSAVNGSGENIIPDLLNTETVSADGEILFSDSK